MKQHKQCPDSKTTTAIGVIESQFSGPIPHPDIISKYEEVLPGSADRIIKMAEQQASHRQEMQKIQTMAESRDSLLGIICAFFISIGSLLAGVIIVILVRETAGAIAGAILSAIGVSSIVATFLTTTRNQKKK